MAERQVIWGWGVESAQPGPAEIEAIVAAVRAGLGRPQLAPRPAPAIEAIRLRPARVQPPPALAALALTSDFDRAAHTYGKSFPELVRALALDFANPPDVVMLPGTEQELVDVLDWCDVIGAAAIPFGGGTNTVGGVQAPEGDRYPAVVSIDLAQLDGVLEIDRQSRAARIQAGIRGPALEAALRPHGLTLRHFPQSFEHSTLGGWIATRSGGHFATLYTHIDEFVESLRVVTPRGVIATRRLPGSGAGPSPDRLFMGSEGTLGVITEAWMRLQDRPRFRASAAVRFERFESGVEAVRVLSQSGLNPSNCRLLDGAEVRRNRVGDGTGVYLMVGFESHDHPLDAWIARALECCRDLGGTTPQGVSIRAEGTQAERTDAAGDWRGAFIRMPYQLGVFAALGTVFDTVESAIPWNRFAEFHAGVMERTQRALNEVCGGGVLSCRFTHVYPDGPAPYYTFLGPGRAGAEVEQWLAVKAAACEAMVSLGGTITHHHAVGRFNRPWYDQERDDLFAASLRAVKATLDPQGLLNPGVLIDC